MGRLSVLGTGVDDGVLRIERTYEIRGLLEKVTSYDAESAGTVVNEVLRVYNDLGMLTQEYQEHEGSKDGSTPSVQYGFDDTVSSGEYTKGMRFNSLTYPNGGIPGTQYRY